MGKIINSSSIYSIIINLILYIALIKSIGIDLLTLFLIICLVFVNLMYMYFSFNKGFTSGYENAISSEDKRK